jgi:hypothetical protein
MPSNIVYSNIKLGLHVVIDEAGNDEYREYFNTAEKIEEIVTAVQRDMKFTFLKRVHLTLAGTRLETLTDTINSLTDTTKFRMQSWTTQNFDAMVDASFHTQKDLVKRLVHGFPILDSLTSNARCAFYLLIAMNEYSFLHI